MGRSSNETKRESWFDYQLSIAKNQVYNQFKQLNVCTNARYDFQHAVWKLRFLRWESRRDVRTLHLSLPPTPPYHALVPPSHPSLSISYTFHIWLWTKLRRPFSWPGAGWEEACISPILSSNVMALMLREHKMASLSTRWGSSKFLSLADKITHISQRFTFTARRLARFRGEPWNRTLQKLHKTAKFLG